MFSEVSFAVLHTKLAGHSQKFRTIIGVTYVIISNALIGSRLSRKQVTPAPALTSQLVAEKIKIIWQILSLV